MKKMLFALVLVLVLLVLAASILVPPAAEAACPAPGGGYAGALNMMHSAAMALYPDGGPMSKNNPLGNDGMFLAVANSSCGQP